MHLTRVAQLIDQTMKIGVNRFLNLCRKNKAQQSAVAAGKIKQHEHEHEHEHEDEHEDEHEQQRGQGMVEYVIIVALVAVAAIGVFQLFGQVIRSQTAAIALELAGEDGSEMSQQAGASAQSATEQSESKGLQNFTGNAQVGP